MPRHELPRTPKGFRQPGSGRKKGTPNKISVELRTLVSQLLTDTDYQFRLRRDFRRRKVHPTIESLIWAYHLGKPSQPIAMTGSMTLDVNAKLEEERRVFAMLDIGDLEQLAADSQALVNRAFKLANIANPDGQVPQDVVVGTLPDKDPSETLGISPESDKQPYVDSELDFPKDQNSVSDNEIADSDHDTSSRHE